MMDRIRTIIGKEWIDVRRNKVVFSVVVFVPLLMTAIPVAMLFMMSVAPISQGDMNELGRILDNPLFNGMAPAEAMQAVMASNMLVLFLMMPLMVPVTIAAYSIVGEKITRSLEPLLATPITTTELLVGKGIAAAVPGIVVTWLAYATFLVFAHMLAVSDRVFATFIDGMWLVAMFVLVPLLTLLAVNFGIIISSRTSDPRAAEQLGALIVLPLMILFLGGLSGFIALSSLTFWITSAAVALLNVVVAGFAVMLFQRETILTRWK